MELANERRMPVGEVNCTAIGLMGRWCGMSSWQLRMQLDFHAHASHSLGIGNCVGRLGLSPRHQRACNTPGYSCGFVYVTGYLAKALRLYSHTELFRASWKSTGGSVWQQGQAGPAHTSVLLIGLVCSSSSRFVLFALMALINHTKFGAH